MSDATSTPWVPPTPEAAWQALVEGNERFVSGTPAHPGQDSNQRARLARGQRPFALIFGCADSRVAAEIVFDQGLGDLFVVRTAGHVVDPGVIGSLEFGVHLLGIPLIVVLGHDSCGAVSATVQAMASGDLPPGYIRDIIGKISPSVMAAQAGGSSAPPEIGEVEAEHVRQTARLLVDQSRILYDAVEAGRCAIMGATYTLAQGRVRARTSTARPRPE